VPGRGGTRPIGYIASNAPAMIGQHPECSSAGALPRRSDLRDAPFLQRIDPCIHAAICRTSSSKACRCWRRKAAIILVAPRSRPDRRPCRRPSAATIPLRKEWHFYLFAQRAVIQLRTLRPSNSRTLLQSSRSPAARRTFPEQRSSIPAASRLRRSPPHQRVRSCRASHKVHVAGGSALRMPQRCEFPRPVMRT